MKVKTVPVNEPLLDGNEENYLVECIRTGWISSDGPFVTKFENDFSSRVGRRFGIAVCNGSVAIDLAIAALNIGVGDEVIMPAHTIISCAAPVVRSGAIPVLIDCDLETYNMKVSDIEKRITSKTKAIMIVHIFGLPVDMGPVLDIAKKYGLKVIEDAAEMHGQTYYGKPCGSFGDISTFSFYANKHITTGEGGMVLTDDPKLADRISSLKNLCFKKEQRFVHDELGWNFRMSNLQAAVGVAQLERLDQFIVKKRNTGNKYNKLLEGLPGVQLPVRNTDYAENIYWVYPILLNEDIQCDAQKIMHELGQCGVGTRPFFWSISQQPVFKNNGLFLNEECPVAELISRKGFYIPSGMAITDDQIDYVAEQVKFVIYNNII